MPEPTPSSTPDRILRAGCQEFAEHGYHGATTHGICARADANAAAVNYHYGSKENLYRAVWEHGHRQSERLLRATVPDDAAPEERLDAFVAFGVFMALSDQELGWFGRLIHNEISNPGPLADELRERFLLPRLLRFERMVRDVVGPNVPEQRVRLACYCIHSALVHLNEIHQRPGRLPTPDGGPLASPAALAETVHTFATAGLHELRLQYMETVE